MLELVDVFAPWVNALMRHRMIHHVSLGVADIDMAAAFYDAALAALGYARVWEDLSPSATRRGVGYGMKGSDDEFAIKEVLGSVRPPGRGLHIAFAAPSRDAVDSFHAAALARGGQCNGAPGIRSNYGLGYYAAFVTDPDGYEIEAVHYEGQLARAC